MLKEKILCIYRYFEILKALYINKIKLNAYMTCLLINIK